MSPLAQILIQILSAGTLLIQIMSVLLIVMYGYGFLKPKNKSVIRLKNLISNNYVVIVLIVSGLATAGSLSLSEIVNFAPCKLCWYQRVLMYPQALIAFVALITNDTKIRKFILPLSIIGILIATYHILLQIFPTAFQCNDEVAKCSAIQFAQFGYITIPVMAFSSFLFVILVSLFKNKD